MEPENKEKTASRPKHAKQHAKKHGKSGAQSDTALHSLKKRAGKGEKRFRKLRARDLLFLLIPAVAVAIAAVCVYFFTQEARTLTLTSKPCQYYAGNTYYLPAGAALNRTSDNQTTLISENREDPLTSLPIYYEDRDEITLPQNMGYYDPRSGLKAKAEFFSSVDCTSKGAKKLKRDGKETNLSQGFLFDGVDLYVFLEDVVVEFNGYRIELPALSFAEARYGGMVMLFNYDTKEFMMEEPLGNAMATAGGGDYTVSLLADSMKDRTGDRTLLISRPDVLDPLM